MRDFKNFRHLDETEIKIVLTALNQISHNIALFIKDKHLSSYILTYENPEEHLIYLISKKLRKVISSFQNNINIASAGLYMGFILRNTFFLSLEGAEFFFKQNLIPDQKIFNVSNRAEKAILYGNPIVKKMILKTPIDLRKNAILLVLNESRELIALARSEIDNTNFKLLDQGELAATNLTDKGYYLRRKQ